MKKQINKKTMLMLDSRRYMAQACSAYTYAIIVCTDCDGLREDGRRMR